MNLSNLFLILISWRIRHSPYNHFFYPQLVLFLYFLSKTAEHVAIRQRMDKMGKESGRKISGNIIKNHQKKMNCYRFWFEVCNCSDAHRTRRKLRTTLCTGPGPQLKAWPPLLRHTTLNETQLVSKQNMIQSVYPESSLVPLLNINVVSSDREDSFTLVSLSEPNCVRKFKPSFRAYSLPQKERVARRLLSSGGAHLLQIPWQAG